MIDEIQKIIEKFRLKHIDIKEFYNVNDINNISLELIEGLSKYLKFIGTLEHSDNSIISGITLDQKYMIIIHIFVEYYDTPNNTNNGLGAYHCSMEYSINNI